MWCGGIRLGVLLACALGALTPAAAHARKEHGYLTMSDGVELRYTLAVPDGPGQFPTVVSYNGYGAWGGSDSGPFARLGVSVRGTGCSGGTWSPFSEREALDGKAVVEWAGDQPWSSGRVAFAGDSYGAFLQLPIAALRPRHLVAIAPSMALGDLYRDILRPGGILNGSIGPVFVAGRRALETQFLYSDGEATYNDSPERFQANESKCAANQASRPAAEAAFLQMALGFKWDDDATRRMAPAADIENIDVPIFTTAAWEDELLGTRWLDSLSQATVPVFAIVTDGDHSMTWGNPRVQAEQRRFLEHYLLGDGTTEPDIPHLQAWWDTTPVGDPGDPADLVPGWITTAAKWPPPQTQVRRYFLAAGGKLGTSAPALAGHDDFAAVPTGQTVAGTQQTPRAWAPPGGPAYTTPALTQDLVTLGTASADLWVSSTAADTDLQVTLTEVRPDGQEVFVRSGLLRASHRALDVAATSDLLPVHTHREADARPLPATPAKLRVELAPFGHVFRAGSRIRLWVEGPHAVPSPWWGPVSDVAPAIDSIWRGAATASSLALPEQPGLKAQAPALACGAVHKQICRADPLAAPALP